MTGHARQSSKFNGDMLLILSSLVLGLYLLLTRSQPTTTERAERIDHLLPRLSAHDIQRLTLHSRDEQFTIKSVPNDPGSYRLLGDVQGDADPALVRQLAAVLEFSTWKRKFQSEADLPQQATQQLAALEALVETKTSRYQLRFFGPTQTSKTLNNGETYVSVVDGTSLPQWGVVSSKLFDALNRSRQEFRGNQLFPFSIETTHSLDVKHGTATVHLVADELGFSLGDPQVRADRSLTDVLFYHLARTQLTTFLPSSRAEMIISSDDNRYTVTQRGAGQDVTVQFGGSCPEDSELMVARRITEPQISGCVSKTIQTGLNLGTSELTSRSAAAFSADEIDHVLIAGQERTLDLIRRDVDYVLLSRDQSPIPQEAGDEFLKVLSESKLEITQSLKPTQKHNAILTIVGNPRQKGGRSEPWRKADVPSSQQSEQGYRQELHVYQLDDRLVLHRLDDDIWLKVPSRLNWAFNQDDSWARSRELAPLTLEQITWARLERYSPQGQSLSTSSIKRAADGFVFSSETRVKRPSQLSDDLDVPDQTLCRRLLEDLSSLRAVRFVPEATREMSPNYQVTFGGETLSSKHELWVGSRTRGGFLAWLDTNPTAFVLAYEVGLSLPTPLYDRSPAQVEPDDFVMLKLEFEGRSLSFKRVADELEPDNTNTPVEAVGPIVEALRGLSVLSRMPAKDLQPTTPITIIGQKRSPAGAIFELQLVGLVPYQDGLAYGAQLKGQEGTFIISADAVQALKVLL